MEGDIQGCIIVEQGDLTGDEVAELSLDGALYYDSAEINNVVEADEAQRCVEFMDIDQINKPLFFDDSVSNAMRVVDVDSGAI